MTDKQSCKSFPLDFTHCCIFDDDVDDEVVEMPNIKLVFLW